MKSKFSAFLEKVQSYSDEKKRLIGFAVSGMLTFIIVSTSFVIPGAVTEKTAMPESDQNIASPFSLLSREFSQSFSQIKDSFPLKDDIGDLISGVLKKATTTENI